MVSQNNSFPEGLVFRPQTWSLLDSLSIKGHKGGQSLVDRTPKGIGDPLGVVTTVTLRRCPSWTER